MLGFLINPGVESHAWTPFNEKFPDDSEEEPLLNSFKQDVRKVFFFQMF
jgi:hypothetical protein